MAVDKNLFLYDLAVVAIMKNEGPYAKEWLDYHLLAGVNHFYIYDNDSPDNLKEVLQPYIERGIVTYHYYPGKARQYEAYNEAIQNYRFFCRYMAFIDADEFIHPLSNKSITETVDEILGDKENVGGLAVNIYGFGSNFQDTADYSRGVLERFTRRASANHTPPLPVSGIPGGTAHVSTITIPRKVNYFFNPHFAVYYEGHHAINEDGGIVEHFSNNPPTVNKIVMNHYNTKSREEWARKVGRGTADAYHNVYKLDGFSHDSPDNEVFDDSILNYHATRLAIFRDRGNTVSTSINYLKAMNALTENLAVSFFEDVPEKYIEGKLETFLTCRALASFLSDVLQQPAAKFFEEYALNVINKSLSVNNTLSSFKLLLSELPKILKLNYPVVDEIRLNCIRLLPQVMNRLRVYDPAAWKEFVTLQYLKDMLNTFDGYKLK